MSLHSSSILNPVSSFYSTILVCKRRIVDLIPKLEAAVENIKSTESAVMQMQMDRQKEFWNLLKIVCVSVWQILNFGAFQSASWYNFAMLKCITTNTLCAIRIGSEQLPWKFTEAWKVKFVKDK